MARGTPRAARFKHIERSTQTPPVRKRARNDVERERHCFENMAAAGLTITYGELARLLELLPPKTIHQITVGLEHLMEEDPEAGRPFIAALVLSRVGFFYCARRLGRFTDDPNGVDARFFHATELNAALTFWGGSAASCQQ